MVEVAAGLRSRREAVFDEALREAVQLGERGDEWLSSAGEVLIAAGDLRGWRLLCIAAALGDVSGPCGGAVLRRCAAATGPGTSDLRCAALLALAKREHEQATEALAAGVDTSDAVAREYALHGLAGYGDARAVEVVHRRLTAMLARRRADRLSGEEHTALTLAVVYLLRHLQTAADSTGQDGSTDRAGALVGLLRRRWQHLNTQDRAWLSRYWPQVVAGPDAQESPDLPDAAALQHRLQQGHLFTARTTL